MTDDVCFICSGCDPSCKVEESPPPMAPSVGDAVEVLIHGTWLPAKVTRAAELGPASDFAGIFCMDLLGARGTWTACGQIVDTYGVSAIWRWPGENATPSIAINDTFVHVGTGDWCTKYGDIVTVGGFNNIGDSVWFTEKRDDHILLTCRALANTSRWVKIPAKSR